MGVLYHGRDMLSTSLDFKPYHGTMRDEPRLLWLFA